MARAVLASATPSRDDRLFPGDPKQFSPGGAINVVYGASGVLYALKAVGAGRYPEHEEWLVDRSLRAGRDVPLGFYDGLPGVAWVLEQLGRRREALKVLEMCLDRIGETWSERRLDLRSGLAGIGLNLAFFADATGDAALRDAAGTAVALLAERLGEEDSVGKVSGGDHPYAGLVRGSSGPALLFIRWFERTGDARYLDLAAVALRQDLRRCAAANGALYVDEEWRLMPYLADGSVGIGMVLEDFLIHRADQRFADAAMAIRHAAESYFYVQSGLFYGRAGMILHLARVFPRKVSSVHPNVATQVKNLSWHRVLHEGNIAFPGEQLLRLSMDFATGTAGVLFALGAALHDDSLHLPFLRS
jgi:lantibiotic modifying enzyme